MIAHLVVDYGGVISHPQPDDDVERLAEAAGFELGEFVARYWTYRPDYDRGQASVAYWSLVLKHDPGPDLLARLNRLDVHSWNHLNHDTLGRLHQAHDRGLPVSLLSNAPAPLSEWVDAAPWAAFLAQRLYSCRMRVNKPDAAIYQRTLQIIGAEPATTLFVDDRADNTAAARALGMQTITFTSPADLDLLA